MSRDEFIGKLQMVYVGDKNASADIIKEYDRLNNIIKEAIEYIDERFTYDEETGEYYLTHTFDRDNVFDLLKILNKGSNKNE